VSSPKVLAALFVLLLTGCQGAVTSPKGASSTPLASADAEFFRGDYDGAERDYLALIAGGTAGAQSHYSLLLDYTNRFPDALVMARAGAGADSFSLGRLARAQDWSAEVPGAVATGARAVAVKPVDTAARAFYAEALADAGQYDLARTQLVLAQRSARDPFALAEVERNWANYFRSKGDQLEELNHLELSVRAQPAFPERQLELARFDYTNGRANEGDAIAAKIEKAHPHDYLVLVSLGDSLFLQGNPPGAIRLYQEALKVRPNAPAAALGLAEVEVAVNRDFKVAHDVLLAALKANPNSESVFLYLRELDLLVLDIDPAADLGEAGRAAPASLLGARKTALRSVAEYRRTAQLKELAGDPALDEAALAHAYYWLFNFGQTSTQGVGIHAQSKSLPGYSGANSIQRAAHFGFKGDRSAEDIAHTYSATSAVQRWVDTVYHRLPILDREAQGAGYAEAQVGALSIQVLEVGLDKPGRSEPVVYPAPDQAAVPSLFTGGEVPEPLPKGTPYPVGYPITLSVGAALTLLVSEASVTDPAGRDVAFYAIQPGPTSDLRLNQVALVPQRPLRPGRYTVQIAGVAGGQRLQASWQFTVSAL